MPETGHGGFLEVRLLESQWPTVVVLGLAAALICWFAVQRDDRRLFATGLGIAGLALVVAVVGLLVETSRESAMAATRRFVDHAAAARIDEAFEMIHPDATLHAGRVESPGFPRADLDAALDRLRRDHRIEENSITDLEASSAPDGTVWVEMACLTRTASSYGTVPSRWVFEWHRVGDDDDWQVRSLTALSVAGRRPDGRRVIR